MITADRVWPNLKLVLAVKVFLTPKNVNEMRRYMYSGMTSYYHKFSPSLQR